MSVLSFNVTEVTNEFNVTEPEVLSIEVVGMDAPTVPPGGNSDATYLVKEASANLPNALVVEADTGIEFDYSEPGKIKVRATGTVSAGVDSFAGRSGVVTPESGDYGVTDISGLVAALAAKQAHSSNLDSWSALVPGTLAVQNANAINVTGGSIAGTDITFTNNSGSRLGVSGKSGKMTLLVAGNYTTERFITIGTGDADRSLTLSGDATLSGVNNGDQDLSGYVQTDSDARLNSLEVGTVNADTEVNVGGGYVILNRDGTAKFPDIDNEGDGTTINLSGMSVVSGSVSLSLTPGSISYGNDDTGFLFRVDTDDGISLTDGVNTTTIAAGSASFGGDVSLLSHRITNLTDPSQAQDAATKAYVDAVANGLLPKASCLIATTANITLSGEQTIDGVTTSASRVLVKNQSTATQNGIYTSASGSWTRTVDADTAIEIWGAYTYIERGTLNATTLWANTNSTLPTLGSTNLTFGQVAGPGSVTAGTGITITANQVSITATGVSATTYGSSTKTVTLTINAQGQVTAASESTFTGSTSVVTLGTIVTGVWNGSIIASTYGGTGNAFTKFSGPTTSERTKTLRDASDTILELGGSYTPTGTWTNLTLVTPALGSPSSVGTLPAFTLGGAVTGGGQVIDNIIVTGSTFKIAALPGTDNTYQGMVITGRNAGATIAQWEVVYLDSSGTWQLADANGSSTYPARGLAVAGYSNTNAATVLYHGVARNDAWNWTVGGTVFLSTTAGALTQTAPSTSGDKVQIIGYALTADSILVTIASGEYLTVT